MSYEYNNNHYAERAAAKLIIYIAIGVIAVFISCCVWCCKKCCKNSSDKGRVIIPPPAPPVATMTPMQINFSNANPGAAPSPMAGPSYPYAPNEAPYPSNGAPYPTNLTPYPPNGAPYPPNGAPYPPNVAPYPPNGAPYPPNGAPYPPNGTTHLLPTNPTGAIPMPLPPPRNANDLTDASPPPSYDCAVASAPKLPSKH